jgi:tetratricopeptide (TPR) repeat protein
VLGLILYSQFEKYISNNCNEICILVSQFFFDKYSFLIVIISASTLAPLIYIRIRELKNEKAKIYNDTVEHKDSAKIITLLEEKIKGLTAELENGLSPEEEVKLHREIKKLTEELEQTKELVVSLTEQSQDIQLKWIDEALEIYKHSGATKAREYMKKYNSRLKRVKLKEKIYKQAKILLFEAKMAVAEYNYKDAQKLYEEALTFDKNAKNLFEIAHFFQKYKNDYKKSVSYYEESLKLFRELAKKEPNIYNSNLADTLNNLAVFYAKDSSKRQEAEDKFIEALRLYRELAKKEPDIYNSKVAMTLHNLANFYAKDSSKRQEAKDKYNEALKLYEELAKKEPKIYGYVLANTLILGVYLFNQPKNYLDEALKFLAPYSNEYQNTQELRDAIKELR